MLTWTESCHVLLLMLHAHRLMKQINYYGMTLLQNVPVVDNELVKVTSILMKCLTIVSGLFLS